MRRHRCRCSPRAPRPHRTEAAATPRAPRSRAAPPAAASGAASRSPSVALGVVSLRPRLTSRTRSSTARPTMHSAEERDRRPHQSDERQRGSGGQHRGEEPACPTTDAIGARRRVGNRREQLERAMRLEVRQLGQRGAERAELGDGIGAANAGGDVLGQRRHRRPPRGRPRPAPRVARRRGGSESACLRSRRAHRMKSSRCSARSSRRRSRPRWIRDFTVPRADWVMAATSL